jgi:WD40 repeat protein
MYRLKCLLLIVVLLPSSGSGSARARAPKMRHGKTTIIALRCLPKGQQCISASYDGTIVMWDMRSGKRLWEYDYDARSKSNTTYTISHILGMDVSRDGTTVAASYSRNTVVTDTIKGRTEFGIALLDTRTGQLNRVLSGHTDLIGKVVFSPNADLLLSESGDETARLWNVKNGGEALLIKLNEKGADVVFCRSGKLAAIATQPIWGLPPQPIVGLYDVSNGRLMRDFPRDKNAVTALACSSDGQLLAIASGDSQGAQINIWNLESQSARISIPMPRTELTSLSFSDDAHFLALAGYGNGRGLVEIRDLIRGKVVKMATFQAKVTALTFFSRGKGLLLGTDEGQILTLYTSPIGSGTEP